MKILIVDDDVNTVEVIVDQIPWKKIQIDETFFAYGVARAKELMKTEQPEIVMCDIEMPGASGIEFLKWIREENYPAEFIFLTCHNSFDFASEAITYGAIGYVLKPFHLEKTMPVLLKAVSKVKQKKHLDEYQEMGRYVENNRARMIQNFWNDMTSPSTRWEQEDLIRQGIQLGCIRAKEEKYCPVLVSTVVRQDETEESMLYLMQNICSELICGDVETSDCVAYKMDGRNCVLFLLGEEKNTKITAGAKNAIESCKRYLKREVNCFIGNKVPLLFLKDERKKLEEKCCDTPVIRGGVYRVDEQREEDGKQRMELDQQQYMEWLETGKKLPVIYDLKNKVEMLGNGEEIYFQSLYHDFIQVIHAVLARRGVPVHRLSDEKGYKSLQERAKRSAYDFMKWVSFVTQQTISLIQENKENSDVTGQVKKYITEHYAEQFGRNEIADALSFSPDYLSKLFYGETGEHMNDYLNRYRITKAKEMLRNSNDSASEIAQKTGFASASYFSTSFRKYVGMSPNEYRRGDKEVGKVELQNRK